MRKYFMVFGLILFCVNLAGQTYYSRGSSNSYYLNYLASWSTNRDGTGLQPTSFSGAGKYFVVQNGHNLTATAQWTVDSGALVWVESGGRIYTGPFDHAITGKVFNGGTYEVTHDSYSNLGWGGGGALETNSNFILNNSGINFNDKVSYGNLIVQNGEADCRGDTEGFEVKGELRVKAGGVWDGGLTTDQIHSIGSIYMDGGIFHGSSGSAQVTYNLSGNLTVALGYFYGSKEGGACTYNIGGNLLHQNGWFYATFRDSGDLPYNAYNIGGNFTRTGGSYYAVNRVDVGYSSFYLSGTGKNLGLGSVSNARHFIEVKTGAQYNLSNGVNFDPGMQFYVRGTLDAGTNKVTALGSGCTFRVHGLLQTANTNGLSGSTVTTFSSNYDPAISLWEGCTIEYNSAATQTVTPRSDYKNLTLSAAGTKTLLAGAAVAAHLSVGAPLLIDIGVDLDLYGSLSATASITGGNIRILGTSDRLDLPACDLDNLTLNRANGCRMTGPVEVYYMTLSNGVFEISNQTLTITGDFIADGGSITGGTSSNLVVSGYSYIGTLHLPTSITELNLLDLSRANGCSLQGNLAVHQLDLNSGSFNVGVHTLTFYGALNIYGGTLNAGGNSTLSIQSGSVDIDLPPLNLFALIMNRDGRSCNLGGGTNVAELTMGAGTMNLGDHHLQVSSAARTTGGSLTGGSASILTLANTVNLASISGGSLHLYNQLCPTTVDLIGPLSLDWLNLASGTLILVDSYLTIFQGFEQTEISPGSGVMSGSSGSGMNLISNSNPEPWPVPEAMLGTLTVDLAGGCQFLGPVELLTSLALMNGEVDPAGNFTVRDNATITRNLGCLSGPAGLGNNLRLIYLASCEAGFELPAWPEQQAAEISVHGMESVVTVNVDLGLSQRIFIGPECVFDIRGYQLYCEPIVQFLGEGLFWGSAQIPLQSMIFSAPPAGLQISSPLSIPDFQFSHLPDIQQLNSTESIARTWGLDGTLNDDAIITFSWDQAADNGLGFVLNNPAFVYRFAEGEWQNHFGPVFLSSENPRTLTFTTQEFSLWTVSVLDLKAPAVTISNTLQDEALLEWNEVYPDCDYEIWRGTDPYGSFGYLWTTSELSYLDAESCDRAFYKVKAVKNW